MNRNRFPGTTFLALCGLLASQVNGHAENHEPRIECDTAMLERARLRIERQEEPFHSYWLLAKAEAGTRLLEPARPYSGPDPMQFHQKAQEDGMAARLLAYRWQLESHEASGNKAVESLHSWASTTPLPGTKFDPAIRFPNAGMDVARAILPFVATYDLVHDHPALKEEKRVRIEGWFRELSRVVKEGISRWEENDDFGGQEYQNHHAAHVLGLALFGSVLDDEEMIQLALDSKGNPKDYCELISGLILMPGDVPLGGLQGKPLHPGELQDRVPTGEGAGLTYCHLSLTLMLYAADVLTRYTGEDWVNWKAPGGETLLLSAAFYSDFYRLRNARINGGYYFRDHRAIQNHRPFLGTFEIALSHWPDVPNLKAIVRTMNRSKTPRSWLSYYGLPLLTHGVENP